MLPSVGQIPVVPAGENYTDPFAYCKAAGTIDQPDARYTGEATPETLIRGYLKAAGLDYQAEYSDAYQRMTVWRCMEGKVYVCNFGANLPCQSQANTDKNPTQAMAEFCKANPGSDFIPMAVTGHETIFAWRCAGETPEVGEQMSEVDAAGFIANIWYAVEP